MSSNAVSPNSKDKTCGGLTQPEQSTLICTLCCCILIIVMVIISASTLSVRQNKGYGSVVTIPITNATTTNPILEWQFTEPYIEPNDRMTSPTLIWILSTLIVFVIYAIIWLLIFFKDPLNNTRLWLLDDIVSFFKGYILSIFLCYTVYIILSARISLPIRSYYDLCDFDVNTNTCSDDDPWVIQEGHSSFPNPYMGLITSSLAFLSLWLCGKFMQCLLYPKLKGLYYSNQTGHHQDLYRYFYSYLFLSLYGLFVVIIPFIPLYIAIFLCSTMVYDNLAFAWDFNATVIATLIIVYYIYTYYYESPFNCFDISYNMMLAALPKQSIAYQHKKHQIIEQFDNSLSVPTQSASNLKK